MKNMLNSVQLTKPKRNVFDLTHDVKMSGKMGYLYPVMALECVPTDKFVLGADSLIRFAPMLAPIMHRVDVSIHYFFVPNRLVWSNWEKFIVNENNPSTGLPHVMPYVKIDGTLTSQQEQFLDYFGIPPYGTGTRSVDVNALPFFAYNKIYNEYYRDQNLVTKLTDEATDGLNSLGFFQLRKRAYEHDYFTASLPFAQKGTAVDIPLGDVTLKPNWDALGAEPYFVNAVAGVDNGVISQNLGGVIEINGNSPQALDPNGSLEVQATTINDLRRAFKLQEWFERNARGGTRYTESIRAHFGLKSPDARLQRPEYITGVKAPVVISEVLNTTGSLEFTPGSETGNPQGDMAGHGVSVTTGKSGSYYCQEHGYIIGILSVMPKTAYQQGIPKHFLKNDFLDFYFPSFAHLGEQEVKNDEIYAYGTDGIFGYVPRYAEYKFMPSRVAGEFRSTLNFWHLGRIFATQPSLNQTFIECDPSHVSRIFAVQTGDNLWMHVLNRVKAIRPMPKYGTPMI